MDSVVNRHRKRQMNDKSKKSQQIRKEMERETERNKRENNVNI